MDKAILTLSIITPSIATLETQRYPDGCVLFGSSVPVSGSGCYSREALKIFGRYG